VAEGAHDALVAAGATGRVKLTTIDGSCPGVLAVRAGRYAADVMQFPTAMATDGVNAVMAFATRGVRPPPGLHDTGATVIANQPVPGVPAEDTGWGLQKCWG
jgi:fructose transport system substrate-binding protein